MLSLCGSFTERQLIGWPQRVLVDFEDSFKTLDALAAIREFPTIDVEATMSQIVDVLATPMDRTEAFRRLGFLTDSVFHASDARDFEFKYAAVRRQLALAVAQVERRLLSYQLYINNQLPYDYAQRTYSGRALLRLQRPRPD